MHRMKLMCHVAFCQIGVGIINLSLSLRCVWLTLALHLLYVQVLMQQQRLAIYCHSRALSSGQYA